MMILVALCLLLILCGSFTLGIYYFIKMDENFSELQDLYYNINDKDLEINKKDRSEDNEDDYS